MKVKSLALLTIAIGCGLIAMLGVQQALSSGNAKKPAPEDTLNIYVAAQEIPPGMILDETMLKVEKWPKSRVPTGAVTNPTQFQERALVVKAFPGDLILDQKLGEKGKSGASVSIPKNMRVVTVPVNLTMAHSGLIQPGDRVDVLLTYKARDSKFGVIQRTKTVLEFIEVFATDKVRDMSDTSGGSADGKTSVKNISLLVTPQQGNLLMLAVSKGTLQLALRNVDDQEQGETLAVDETVFDSAPVSHGIREEDEEFAMSDGAPEDSHTREASSIQDFLDEQADSEPEANPETMTAEASKAPNPNLWPITIYELDARRVEEVELPSKPEKPAVSEPTASENTNGAPPV